MPVVDAPEQALDRAARPMSGRLGVIVPYFRSDDAGIHLAGNFPQAMRGAGDALIDGAALVEIINRGYCLGTRTLVQGLQRQPAFSRLRDDGRAWEPGTLPGHGAERASPRDVARGLFDRLCAELRQACEGRKKIGLLLSGGMDSRVVACVLGSLLERGEINAGLVALTWGVNDSRDVVYAKRISEQYGWDYRHFDLAPDNLAENITLTAQYGCEVSPLHLHAMPKVAEQSDLDLVVAASLGDSMGRAEFSGLHVTRLKPMSRHLYNRFKILKDDEFRRSVPQAYVDAGLYRDMFPRSLPWQAREIDHQLHYVQRMLVPCFEIINERVQVHQAFTSPAVHRYMWSFDLVIRNDVIYRELLEENAPELLTIPWARTGKPYLEADGGEDGYARDHNRYGLWMRRELREQVKERVLSKEIERLSTFNMKALRMLLRYSEHGDGAKATQLQEILIWIAALSECVALYGIQGAPGRGGNPLGEWIDGYLVSMVHAVGFDGRVKARRLMKRVGW
ncbi:MAG: asparagine synthase-related protein [Arenicellales bacterium]